VARLYLETNYLMSRSTGRSPDADQILSMAPDFLEIAIPSVCFMEAYKAFAALSYEKRALQEPFLKHINDIKRDPGAFAQEFARNLAAADAALTNYLGECEDRLDDSISEVLGYARLVETTSSVLADPGKYLSDRTDDMILSTIIVDAQKNGDAPIRFLSEDGGFRQPTVQRALATVAIETLESASECLVWMASL
jgi:hypothetical protein